MKILNFAIIGAGNFGKNYIRVLREVSGAKLQAVTTQEKESLSFLSKSLSNSINVTDNTDQVLEDPNIDCVVIATPPSTHFAIAKKAIENNKHVLLEKPMVMNLREANLLKISLKKNPVTFMVGHQYVYHNYVNYLKKHIARREFGKINCFFGEHFYPWSARYTVGCLYDAGTHQLSIIQHLFNPGILKKVRAERLNFSNSQNEDFMWAQLSFQNGLRAVFILSQFSLEKTRKCIVVGNKKFAIFDDIAKDNKLKISSVFHIKTSRKHVNPLNVTGINSVIPKIKEHEPLLNQLNHFIKCINYGLVPMTGIDKSIQITRWLGQIEAAMNKKR